MATTVVFNAQGQLEIQILRKAVLPMEVTQ